MNSSLVQRIHTQEDNNAREWALMLAAPQDHLCRAPSNTPFLASMTRFVKSVDIPYAQTNNGAFTVAMMPNALQALGISGPNANIPAAPDAISVSSTLPNTCVIEPGESTISSGLLNIGDANGDSIGTTAFRDLSGIDALLDGISGFTVTAAATTTFTSSVEAVGNFARNSFLRIVLYQDVAGTKRLLAGSAVPAVGAVFNLGTYTNGATVTTLAIGFQLVTAAGVPIVRQSNLPFLVNVSFSAAYVPGSSSASNFSLASSEIIEAGNVQLQRCTAMSLLVTNMAPPLTSGGELVAARTGFNILATPGGTAGLMAAIKQLPEERYWRSGPIVDGCYAWWIPDDLASYEPLPIVDVPPTENVLVAAGVMSDATGFVRVIATWTFEFYTPVQLFSRSYNSTYAQSHRDMFNILAREPAVSANFAHLAILASIGTAVNTAYRWYKDNAEWIDPIAKKGGKAALNLLRQKPTKSEKQKQKQKLPKSTGSVGQSGPPLPPRPKK